MPAQSSLTAVESIHEWIALGVLVTHLRVCWRVCEGPLDP